MDDLISREAAIEAIKAYCNGCDNYNGVRCRACNFEDAMIAVDSVLAVDAVEVVRCKDCVYSFRTQPLPPPGKRRNLKHGNECAIHRCYVSNNEFCSRGETLEQKDRREAAYEQLCNSEDGSL